MQHPYVKYLEVLDFVLHLLKHLKLLSKAMCSCTELQHLREKNERKKRKIGNDLEMKTISHLEPWSNILLVYIIRSDFSFQMHMI